MLNVQKTKEAFGYESVGAHSAKPVIWSCDHCGKDFEKSMRKITDGKGACCSNDCRTAKRKATNLSKYGAALPLQSSAIMAKLKTTNQERYGVDFAVRSETVQAKVKAANLERYGVEYAVSAPEVREKIRITSLERHGIVHPPASEIAKAKYRATIIARTNSEETRVRKAYRKRLKADQIGAKKGNIGFDGRMFLLEEEYRTYERRMPVRYASRTKTDCCALCGLPATEGNPLEASHKIGFHQGLRKFGLTPDYLDQPTNTVMAHRKVCNNGSELSDEQVCRLLHNQGVDELPLFVCEATRKLFASINNEGDPVSDARPTPA